MKKKKVKMADICDKFGVFTEIKTMQPTINIDMGFDLPAIYNEIIPVTRDCSRQTSDHSSLTIVAVAGRSVTM